MRALPPIVGDGHSTRLACCIPFCRRTFRYDKNGTPWPEGHETMCGKHWRMIGKDRRRRWSKLYRLYKNKRGTLQGDMADRVARMLSAEFDRFKKIATEAAAGIA